MSNPPPSEDDIVEAQEGFSGGPSVTRTGLTPQERLRVHKTAASGCKAAAAKKGPLETSIETRAILDHLNVLEHKCDEILMRISRLEKVLPMISSTGTHAPLQSASAIFRDTKY
uniref:Uncharacterized protein n=1 Tax=Coleopteran chu-related virus OKIAV151 TaxID=2746340 RepID=A0A7D7EY81_9VIRU|nr:hypothetical protein [Coleopteran chu-related virus OKIAV151]